jgi:hypothetical protein
VICKPPLAEQLSQNIGQAFNEMAKGHYSAEDQERGFIIVSGAGEDRRALLMNCSIAQVNVKPGQFKTTEELASEMTRAKAATRKKTSGFFVLSPLADADK